MSWLTPEQMAKHDITPEEVAEFEAIDIHDDRHETEKEEPTVTHKYPIDDALYGRVQADERTGLPAYPKVTAAAENKLRNVQKKLATTADRLNSALDRALAEFEEAFAAEDRKQSTQARIDALTKTHNQRRS